MTPPLTSVKVIIEMRSRSGLWHAQTTTVQIHRHATAEEYSAPIPPDGFESEDFVLVKEHAVENALAWINSKEGPQNISGEIQLEVQIIQPTPPLPLTLTRDGEVNPVQSEKQETPQTGLPKGKP